MRALAPFSLGTKKTYHNRVEVTIDTNIELYVIMGVAGCKD